MRRWIVLLVALSLPAWSADGLFPRKAATDFLPVDQAFDLQPLELREGAVEVSWRIAKDYYLYRDRLKFTLAAPAGAKLGAAQLPPAQPYHDEHFGATQVYRDRLVARLPVSGSVSGPLKLTVTYQGCADAGLCYPPQTRTLEAAR